MIGVAEVIELIRIVGINMPARRRNPRRKRSSARMSTEPAESRRSEVLTIAWTVSVTGVLVADLMLVAAHLYSRSHPEEELARNLQGILLLFASAMGIVSLALLPVVWRMRRLKPPMGYIVFAILVTVSPILATIVRLLR
jgi:hypothetical protein